MCISKGRQAHSNVKICDQQIIKTGPAALLINEYVTLFAYSAILGKDNIQLPLDIAFYKNGAAKLTLEKFDNFIPAKIAKNIYSYLENTKVPALTLAVPSDIKEDFSEYTPKNSMGTQIGGKEVVGFFKTHLASMLLSEADVVGLVKIGLKRSEEHYTVTRFDTDDSFRFLSSLQAIKKSHIEEFYGKVDSSIPIMFKPLDMEFSPNKLLQPWLAIQWSGYEKLYQALPQRLASTSLMLGYNPDMLGLEKGFSDFFLNFDIDNINSIIANGFENLKAITPKKTLQEIYNPKHIHSLIEKGLLNIKLSVDNFEYDHIRFPDIKNHQVVQKYCTTTNLNENSHVLDDISYIAQCMTAIRYAQISGTGLCYIALKHKYDHDFKLADIIGDFPQPNVNYHCYRPMSLNNNICNANPFTATQADTECVNDLNTNFSVCDMIGEYLDVCGNVPHTEL